MDVQASRFGDTVSTRYFCPRLSAGTCGRIGACILPSTVPPSFIGKYIRTKFVFEKSPRELSRFQVCSRMWAIPVFAGWKQMIMDLQDIVRAEEPRPEIVGCLHRHMATSTIQLGFRRIIK